MGFYKRKVSICGTIVPIVNEEAYIIDYIGCTYFYPQISSSFNIYNFVNSASSQ